MTEYTWSDALAAQREREEALEEAEAQAFVRELEKRPMSSWTDAELRQYNKLTGQEEEQ